MHGLTQLDTPVQASQWLRKRVTGVLHTDSRQVQAGDGFIAWPGAATDGRRYVADALAAGAAACLVEAQGVQDFGLQDARIASYTGLKAATGLVADEYYGHASQALDVVAITGTNGKTSTAWWVAQALNTLSKPASPAAYACGLVGTLGIGTPGQMVFNGLTTPDPVLLQAQFAQMRSSGARACAIEASSIGLAEQRLAGTAVRVAVFTNLTQDHLDYHGNMATYWQSKRSLFDWAGLQSAVVNLDDAYGAELSQHCAARGVQVWTTSLLRTDATLWAQAIDYTDTGMQFVVNEGAQTAKVQCAVVGQYNVSNLLGVIAVLRSLGIDLAAACRAVSASTAVPGRMECVTAPGAPLVAVDYAHTPDALDKVLAAMRPMAHARGGQLWCVFGCGGDRDASKRPLMAAAAERGANTVVVTSDNPRSEQPEAIIAQIVSGFASASRAKVQPNRALAIVQAVQQAQPEDVIVLAGKGHEDYQDIAGTKHPFSDVAHAQAALQQRLKVMAT
jgi:UDP-N-acetylmuramyl-tripeptide synthetase